MDPHPVESHFQCVPSPSLELAPMSGAAAGDRRVYAPVSPASASCTYVARDAAVHTVSSLVTDNAWRLLCLGPPLAAGKHPVWPDFFLSLVWAGSYSPPLCIPWPHQAASCGWHTGPACNVHVSIRAAQLPLKLCLLLPSRTFLYLFPCVCTPPFRTNGNTK